MVKVNLAWCSWSQIYRCTTKAFYYKERQVVKVTWHKAASPPHMDSSIVFTAYCQCAFNWVHRNQYPNCSSAAPCWVTLSILTTGNVRICPSQPLLPSIFPLHMWDFGNHLIHGSSGPSKSTSWMASWSVQPLCMVHGHNKQTDIRPYYSQQQAASS